jgi:hypothetical protein
VLGGGGCNEEIAILASESKSDSSTQGQFNIGSLESVSCRLYGLMVRDPAYRSRGPGSISGATRFSEK